MGRRGRERSFESGRPNQIFENGTGVRIPANRQQSMPYLDFHRIKRENEALPNDRLTKKRRLARGVQGVHAPDMSLVTPESAPLRPGWRVTPMGRIVHPIRMRPEKPLPPVSSVTSSTTGKDGKKRRKREKPKLVRARRRTIDPTKWDSQHLKGIFLDSIVVADDGDNLSVTAPSQLHTSGDQEEPNSSSNEEQRGGSEDIVGGSPTTSDSTDRSGYIAHTSRDVVDVEHDFNQEKLHALSLLDSMFGGLEGDQEWSGREALDSDVDMPELPPVQTSHPSESSPLKEGFKEPDLVPATEDIQGDSGNEESSASTSTPVSAPASVATQNEDTKAKLRDLFAPQEEQSEPPLPRSSNIFDLCPTGFSLLNQLDLDLELEDEEPFPTAPLPSAPSVAVQPSAITPSSSTRVSLPHAQVTLDATQPLFFPFSTDERANRRGNAKLKDIMDVFREKGLDPRSTGFYRTESSEEIVKRWEEAKGDLTRDWKKRHREAVKSRRRRGGGADGD